MVTPADFTWTTAATDNFNRADSTTSINPSSDGGTYTVIRGGAGIISGQGYFPVMSGSYDDALVWRDVGSDIQDVSVDNYRSATYGSGSIILNWDGVVGGAHELDFDSSASATFHHPSGSEAVTLTPWTGGTTRLRMVSYHGTDSVMHVDIYQDGVQVHAYAGPYITRTGISFGTGGHSFHTFDDRFDNLVVMTGVLIVGPVTVPPLRQVQRDDGALDGSARQFTRNAPTSLQASARQLGNTYL